MKTIGLIGEKRRPDWAALVIGAALALLGAVVAYDAGQLSGGGYARVGPATFPYVVATGLFGLSIWTVVAAWRSEFPEREPDELGPVVWIVGGLAAQMLLLSDAGFSVATGVLFGAAARAFGRPKLWKTIPAGISLSLLIWFFFAKLLRLQLPAGPLEQLFM